MVNQSNSLWINLFWHHQWPPQVRSCEGPSGCPTACIAYWPNLTAKWIRRTTTHSGFKSESTDYTNRLLTNLTNSLMPKCATETKLIAARTQTITWTLTMKRLMNSSSHRLEVQCDSLFINSKHLLRLLNSRGDAISTMPGMLPSLSLLHTKVSSTGPRIQKWTPKGLRPVEPTTRKRSGSLCKDGRHKT